jgi:hypothetical protein
MHETAQAIRGAVGADDFIAEVAAPFTAEASQKNHGNTLHNNSDSAEDNGREGARGRGPEKKDTQPVVFI